MNVPTCTWTGVSGYPYTYAVYPFGTSIIDEPGNYILCRAGTDGVHYPLYIGESERLSTRCCMGHEKWLAAIQLGVTHIHVHFNRGGNQARVDEETDLRRGFNPPLNDQ